MFSGAPAAGSAVRNLLIATIGAYLLQVIPVVGAYVLRYGALVPSAVFSHGQAWRLLTYLFLHDLYTPFHLFFNMLALWMFGVELESMWGAGKFYRFYLVTGVGSALLSFIMWDSTIIGASGAILGLLTAYAWYFPNRTILMFFIFPVPVRLAVLIIGLISLFLARTGGGTIAHLTHLGGIVAALAYLKFERPVADWLDGAAGYFRERRTRSDSAQQAADDRYFENVIDPILKRISDHGMDSLTSKEKETLRDASKKHRGMWRGKKVVPGDFR